MSERITYKLASIVILEKESKVFLMRRYNTGWEDGKYNLPSGHVEANETPKETAIRECNEETGVIIQNEDLDFVHMDFLDNYIHLYFRARKWEGKPTTKEKDKCDDTIWAEYSNLPTNLAGRTLEALNHIKDKNNYSEYSPNS